MAVATRKRKVVRRKLSAKQVKYFGTRAQKAALRRKRAGARPQARRKVSYARSYAKKAVKRKATKRKPVIKTETNWWATGAAGLAGLGVGGALGTVFGDKIKGALSNLPIVGQYFAPAVAPAADSAMVNAALTGGNPQITIASLAPAPGPAGTAAEVYQDYHNWFDSFQPQPVIGGESEILGYGPKLPAAYPPGGTQGTDAQVYQDYASGW